MDPKCPADCEIFQSNSDSQNCYQCQYNDLCLGYSNYYGTEYSVKLVNRIVALVSGLFLTFVGLFILGHRNFKGKHPYYLIGLACTFEAQMYSIEFYSNFICSYDMPFYLAPFLGLPKMIFAGWSWSQINEPEQRLWALKILQVC